MKILSGRLRGKNFYMPFGIRPTQDLIRKAIFDIILAFVVPATVVVGLKDVW